MITFDYKQGDVNGDKIPDIIYLTGNKTPDSPFVQDITLVIIDGKNDNVYKIPLETNAGYNPTLFLGDFTGDDTLDILVSMDSGGSGGVQYHYVYSFLNNKPKILFNYNDFNRAYKYKVIYRDYYKVDIISITLNTIYAIDIKYKGQDYLSEIYYENGKLKKPIEGWVNPLSSLWPIDIERNGTYELYAVQRIAGRYNADALGYVETILQWNGFKFIPFQQYVAIFGKEISK
jgi:hypothetical protein